MASASSVCDCVPVVVAEAVVEAGPSQCQWSPCGSQPTDSVGLGTAGVAVSDIDAGPSQCLDLH